MKPLAAVKGMHDLLPADSGRWHQVETRLAMIAGQYGYRELRTPILEYTDLFRQSLGRDTDIVGKEMYSFVDAGDQALSMRPEATASSVRACIQHGLLRHQRQRLWYLGPMFRRERPQRGRCRQFHQFGIEAFGWPGPEADAEVIAVSARIMRDLKIDGLTLKLNSLGSPAIRQTYRDRLTDYFAAHRDALDEAGRLRLERNPLRLLDSKDPALRPLIEAAPNITDCFDDSAKRHFDRLRELLEATGIDYVHEPLLVRGLDYYTATVFEWSSPALGAQDAVCAGGRYDLLVGERGGPDTPGVGFALGLERLMELCGPVPALTPDLCVLALGPEQQVLAAHTAERLRDAGFSVISHADGGLRSLLKSADRSAAALAVLLGPDEQAEACATLRDLRDGRGRDDRQWSVPHDELVERCRALLPEASQLLQSA